MLLYSSICICITIMHIILSSIFDAQQWRIVSTRSYVYTIQNDVYIFITRSVSNAIVDMDRPIISIKSVTQITVH